MEIARKCCLRARVFKLEVHESIPSNQFRHPTYVACAEIFKQSMEARNRVRIGLSNRPAIARTVKPLRSPRIDPKEPMCSMAGRYDNPILTWFLAPIDSLKIPTQATQPGGIVSFLSVFKDRFQKCKFYLSKKFTQRKFKPKNCISN